LVSGRSPGLQTGKNYLRRSNADSQYLVIYLESEVRLGWIQEQCRLIGVE